MVEDLVIHCTYFSIENNLKFAKFQLSTRKANLKTFDLFYKNKGIYKITEDNGLVQIVYMIYIENDEINISYNYMSHSEIIEGFNEYTDYHSENEFSFNWQFKFTKTN